MAKIKIEHSVTKSIRETIDAQNKHLERMIDIIDVDGLRIADNAIEDEIDSDRTLRDTLESVRTACENQIKRNKDLRNATSSDIVNSKTEKMMRNYEQKSNALMQSFVRIENRAKGVANDYLAKYSDESGAETIETLLEYIKNTATDVTTSINSLNAIFAEIIA